MSFPSKVHNCGGRPCKTQGRPGSKPLGAGHADPLNFGNSNGRKRPLWSTGDERLNGWQWSPLLGRWVRT